MRRGRGVDVLIAAALSVVACSPAPPSSPTPRPSPSPSSSVSTGPVITAPPVRADVTPWPDVTWSSSAIQQPPAGFSSERVAAVAGDAGGFAAVGSAETAGSERGSIWFSPNGAAWQRTGEDVDLAGVSLVDVAWSHGVFVAIGTRFGDSARASPTRTVTLRSSDGLAWERLPDDTDDEAYAGAVAAGPAGFLATRFTLASDALQIRSSTDGRAWQLLPPAAYGDAASGMRSPVWTSSGWVAAGVRFGSPVILRSTDGATWTAQRLEPASDDGDIATDVVAGTWGTLAIGIASSGCGGAASCAGRRVAWWSADGRSWGRTADQAAIDDGLLVSDGDRGVISLSGVDAWSSPDGWRWRPLGQPAMDLTQVNDAVILGNIVVAVGDTYRDDSTAYPTFLLAGPVLQETN